MAEEVTGRVTNGNGERLSFQVGTKSFGIQARDLIPVLLLLMMGVGGYLLYTNVREGLRSLETQQSRVETGLHENRESILRAVQDWRAVVDEQTAKFRRMLELHDYNMGREPTERLPLEAPLPPSQPPRQ